MGVWSVDLPCACSTRAFIGRALREQGRSTDHTPIYPIQAHLPTLLGDSLVDPRLRASNEHILIVRTFREQEDDQDVPSPFFAGPSPHPMPVRFFPASSAPLPYFLNS